MNYPRLALAGAAMLLFCAGCNKDSEPISAATSKYEVGEDDKTAADSTASLPNRSEDTTSAPSSASGNSPPRVATSEGPSRRNDIATEGPVDQNVSSTDTSDSRKPPVVPREQLDTLTPPKGPPEKIWEFIEALGQRQPRGNTQQEMFVDAQKIIGARIKAAEMILAHADAKPDLRRRCVQVKLASMQQLADIGVTEVEQHVREFCTAISTDVDEEIASTGRLMSFTLDVGDLVQGRIKDPQVVLKAGKKLLQEEQANEPLFENTRLGAMILLQSGFKTEGLELVDAIGVAFEKHEDAKLQRQLKALGEEARFLELELHKKLDAFDADESNALATLAAGTQTLLAAPNPGVATLQQAAFIADAMERKLQLDAAKVVYQQIADAYKGTSDENVGKLVQETVEFADRRLNLPGQSLTLDGKVFTGEDLKWSDYQGKVLLITFWSAENARYMQQELPRIKQLHDIYKGRGFEVVGVNVDENRDIVEQFFSFQPLPWANVMDGLDRKNLLLDKCGVSSIPFNILLDRDGVVVGIHVSAQTLPKKLLSLLSNAPGEQPEVTAPQGQVLPRGTRAAFAMLGHEPVADESFFVRCAVTTDEEKTAEQSETTPTATEQDNPYLAPAGLSRQQLVDYLFKSEEKPKSIRERPGFDEALLDATDRVLAGGIDDALGLAAAEMKFQILHRRATKDVEGADEQLWTFVQQMKDDTRPRIAHEVSFLTLEHEALQVDQLPLEDVPEFLKRLREFLASEELGERHLRLASAAVHAVNRLDVEQREEHFQALGQLFAKSKDVQLARYGRKVADTPAMPNAELIGQTVELAGVTALGVELDWNRYRGKIVLVDFWATWCGPCRRETPAIKGLLEKHADGGFEVVGVNLDFDSKELAKYIEEQAITWDNLIGDDAKQYAQRYGVDGIPTLMLLDRDGKVVAVAHHSAELTDKLEALLK